MQSSSRVYNTELIRYNHSTTLLIQLSDQCLAAAEYERQQTAIQCEDAKEQEQRLEMALEHCRELQIEFRDLKQVAVEM